MPKQFIETDKGFINVRLVTRIWWDKESDGWMLEYDSTGTLRTAYPSEGPVHELLGLED